MTHKMTDILVMWNEKKKKKEKKNQFMLKLGSHLKQTNFTLYHINQRITNSCLVVENLRKRK